MFKSVLHTAKLYHPRKRLTLPVAVSVTEQGCVTVKVSVTQCVNCHAVLDH